MLEGWTRHTSIRDRRCKAQIIRATHVNVVQKYVHFYCNFYCIDCEKARIPNIHTHLWNLPQHYRMCVQRWESMKLWGGLYKGIILVVFVFKCCNLDEWQIYLAIRSNCI